MSDLFDMLSGWIRDCTILKCYVFLGILVILNIINISNDPKELGLLTTEFEKDQTLNIGLPGFGSSFYSLSDGTFKAYSVVYPAESDDDYIEIARLLVPSEYRGNNFGMKCALNLIEHLFNSTNEILIDTTNESRDFWVKVLTRTTYRAEQLSYGKFVVKT
ncbi:hypothetical protein [Vibrio splendidus]|nr:hypothetical protein [Vibrio splendidus]